MPKRWICCLLPALLWLPLQAQPEQTLSFQKASQIFGKQRTLNFRQYALELNDESRLLLEQTAVLIRSTPALVHSNVLVLQVFTCEEELLAKPYIGVVRAKLIVDYLEQELGLSRKKCYIQDTGASAFDEDCTAGSGLHLVLRPAM